jgi:aspartate aminotransferase
MFAQLPEPQQDPILSLSIAYRQDDRLDKVDLGIGVYRNSQGETPIMKAVAIAQKQLAESQLTKAYVGLAGNEDFNQSMLTLLLGNSDAKQRASVIQTPGASGGLRMLADLIYATQPNATVWVSNPSYVNHQPVMEAAGLKVNHYAYFDATTKQVNENQMLSDLRQVKKGDVVLLHGCCHNPTGADISFETWVKLTELSKDIGFIPFIDIAYQGFGDSIEQDAKGLQYMSNNLDEVLITSSCSKNFGLYRERTGCAVVVATNSSHAVNAKGKLLQLARATYTMPPDHGAAIVNAILSDKNLTQIWESELIEMQQRLVKLRSELVNEIKALGDDSFEFINLHKGMFTLLGFTSAQMLQLREEYGIYGVADGRINIAGLAEEKISYVANAIYQVSNN